MIFSFFLTWWGAFVMAALDTTMVFFVPFGIDALVVYLAARNHQLFWLYPLLATAGSCIGAGVTFWLGEKAGEHGLERFAPPRRLERVRDKIRNSGAVAIAVPAIMPPPFPLTPFILTCGALAVDRWRFFVTFAGVRLLRFGAESILARVYGRGILRILRSQAFRFAIIGFVVVAVVGTVVSAVLLWRSTHERHLHPA